MFIYFKGISEYLRFFNIFFFRRRFKDSRRSAALPVCPDVDRNLCPPKQVETSETRETAALGGRSRQFRGDLFQLSGAETKFEQDKNCE